MAGQAHIIERDGMLKEAEKQAAMNETDFTVTNIKFMGAEEAYDESVGHIKKVNPTPNGIFDAFLAEKALDINKVNHCTPF